MYLTTDEEYDRLHKCCPECGHDKQCISLVARHIHDLDTDMDTNSASCRCGWDGIVHDLVPLKTTA